jgi:hypothetical protein
MVEFMENKENHSLIKKSPIDVRIVSYFLYAIGFLQMALSMFLITGIGRLGANQIRRALFGTILLSTELSFAIYMLCTGFLRLLCAWGLIRYRKFAWFLMFIYCIYDIMDMIYLYSTDKLNASFGLIINTAIIIWLLFRRSQYKIGIKQVITYPAENEFKNR